MLNEEWSPAAIINEELRILHYNIAAKRESFNIPNSKLNIKYYETGNVEDDYSGHCEHSDGYADCNGNDQLHGSRTDSDVRCLKADV